MHLTHNDDDYQKGPLAVPQRNTVIRPWSLCPCDGGCPRCFPQVKADLKSGKSDDGNEQESTLPNYRVGSEWEVEKGPDDRFKSDRTRVGSGTSAAFTTPASPLHKYASSLPNDRITVGKVGVEFSDPRTSAADQTDHENSDGSHRDAVSMGTVGVEWNNPNTKIVTKPFGSESFRPGYKDVKFKRDGKGNLAVDFTLDIECPWGTNSGGNTDVPSPTDAVVTETNYLEIAKDLTPKKKEKCWRPPRKKYWSQAICERHEKFHSTEDKKWSEGPGKKVVIDYLNGKDVPGLFKEKRLKALLKKSMKEMKNASWDFYTGGADSYLSYTGEKRAFADGKVPYKELAKGVRAHGKKLKKEAEKNS